MTWRVLISAPYMLPALDEFRSRLEAEGVEIVTTRVSERLSEEELLPIVGTIDGAINDLLADCVGEIPGEARFLATSLLQKTFGRFRAFALKSGAKLSMTLSQVANVRAGKTPPVRVRRDTGNPEINAEKATRFIGWRLDGVDRGDLYFKIRSS